MKTNTSGAKDLMSYTPEYRCPNKACDCAMISPTHVVITHGRHEWHRTLTVHCEHCDRFHSVMQVATAGFWQKSTDVEEVTDEREIAKLRAHIERAEGTIQLAAG